MKKTLIFTVLLASALAVVSCGRIAGGGKDGMGELKMKVSIPESGTKADESYLETFIQNSLISIYKGDFSGLVRSYSYSGMPEKIYLPADSYRVDVLAGEIVAEKPDSVSWTTPSFYGSTDFEIEANKVNSVKVECGISNIVSLIIFDETITENLKDDFKFEIGFDLDRADRKAVYTKDKNVANCFFIPEYNGQSLYWKFTGVRTRNGAVIEKSGEIAECQKGHLYKFTPKFIVKDGDADMFINIQTSVEVIEDLIIFDPISSGVELSKAYEVWSEFATVHAVVDENSFTDPVVEFKYWKNGTEDYHSQLGISTEGGKYQAVLKGLEAETSYTYILTVNGEEVGQQAQFTTGKKEQLQNPSFDVYSKTESTKYYSFYDPNHTLWNKKYWDTGNEGSTTVGSSNAVAVPETSDVKDGTASIKLMSQYVVIKFAAGSVSTGEFAGLVGTSGGKVNFGRPFAARPTALRFWIKYQSGNINRVGSGAPARSGDPDVATIFIALGTWSNTKYGGTADCPLQVNTTDQSTFWDYPTLPETVAYGIYDLPANKSNGEWAQVTLPLEYFDLKTIPTHVVINCAASKYGDYFTGYDKSTMWLDGMELLYDYENFASINEK